jgi:hypothetical protein
MNRGETLLVLDTPYRSDVYRAAKLIYFSIHLRPVGPSVTEPSGTQWDLYQRVVSNALKHIMQVWVEKHSAEHGKVMTTSKIESEVNGARIWGILQLFWTGAPWY